MKGFAVVLAEPDATLAGEITARLSSTAIVRSATSFGELGVLLDAGFGFDLLVIGASLGCSEIIEFLRSFRSNPRTGKVPVMVFGRDCPSRDLYLAGVNAVVELADDDVDRQRALDETIAYWTSVNHKPRRQPSS